MNVLDKVANSALVDCQVAGIHVSYQKSCVDILVILPSGKNDLLCFDKFLDFSITNHQPWGKGYYICASDVTPKADTFIVEIQLNSGDCISLVVEGDY